MLLTSRFWLYEFGIEPEILPFSQLSGNADATDLRTAFEERGPILVMSFPNKE